ncbi:MAG: TonB-dependent receptor [Verrucomicrobiota bacterium]|nr:TonB-dependent receptor [Verrucomicrobiota bacterium]
MKRRELDTHQKALEINLDPSKYGTFAEIGAGQEVARWFFRVGGAAGTIAKSISAYDMVVSDAIYGPADRYVSRQRLQTMLEHEYSLQYERLNEKRGASTKFFAFADTVTARSFKNRDECHGWMGIRFQSEPRGKPSEIIIHVRMLDRENVSQQEALGIMGVNLVFGALYLHDNPSELITSLLDSLTPERVEVDMIKMSGEAFHHVDNRLMSLQLVKEGLANAAMFTADGEVVQAAEVLHKKAILVERGSFRPVTNVTLDMLHCAQAQFIQEPQVQGEEVVVLMEMTMRNLTTEGGIDPKDFLERVDLLGTLGKTVLISNYGEYWKLASYLFRYTKKMIGLVMGIPSLREIFDEKYYADLEGGILESFGRLFKNALKIYAYPLQDQVTSSVITAGNLRVAPHLRHLYAYLIENHYIQSIQDYDQSCLPIFSRDVLRKMKAGDPTWEPMVPAQVASIIKERRLLGYISPEEAKRVAA